MNQPDLLRELATNAEAAAELIQQQAQILRDLAALTEEERQEAAERRQ